jgi:hypothetical protein
MFSEDQLRELENNQRRANPHSGECRCFLCNADRNEIRDRKKSDDKAAAMLEAELEEACTNILIHDGWRALKTDPVSDRRRGKGFGELGMADYLYLRYWPRTATQTSTRPLGEVMWIEWKRRTESGSDTKAAAHQKDWHRDERAKGALTLIAGEDFPATVNGFLAYYLASGLKLG